MSKENIINQVQGEISRLEQEVESLEAKKKQLKQEIRSHKKALKLLNGQATQE